MEARVIHLKSKKLQDTQQVVGSSNLSRIQLLVISINTSDQYNQNLLNTSQSISPISAFSFLVKLIIDFKIIHVVAIIK